MTKRGREASADENITAIREPAEDKRAAVSCTNTNVFAHFTSYQVFTIEIYFQKLIEQ